jgi:NAD(P)-dependent dehydrogenase (short-subunit alcohol dehydrogenase family)
MSFLNLEGRVILIAGGAGGIGTEIVTVLADSGASIVVADINGDRALAVASDLRQQGLSALGCEVDVSSDESIKGLFAAIEKEFGVLYGLVNAIGVVGVGSALECSIAEYQRQIDINCYGAIRLARSFVDYVRGKLPQTEASEDVVCASLVYISSIAAELAIPERDPYCVSKAAGQLFHMNLANEVARYGINVNVVLPGRTDTPSAAERARTSPAAAASMFATQRRAGMIPPGTIAKACAFLLCPDLIGCSGQKMTIAEGADTTYRPSYEALARGSATS